jgi:RNA polymerase sigma-70 factor (ECF subfamily)
MSAQRAALYEDITWDEQSILLGLRSGEDEAYELVFRRYGSRMLAVARRFLGNEEDAQDAVQDAMLSAFRALDRFEGGSQLGTWLHRIVVNAALMKLRRRRNHRETSIEELLPGYDVDGHRELRVAGDPFPDEQLEREELRALLRESVSELPEGYRQVYLLRDVEELSTEETATALGLSANAVKIRLHRARQALITLVQRRYAERGGAISTVPDRTR